MEAAKSFGQCTTQPTDGARILAPSVGCKQNARLNAFRVDIEMHLSRIGFLQQLKSLMG